MMNAVTFSRLTHEAIRDLSGQTGDNALEGLVARLQEGGYWNDDWQAMSMRDKLLHISTMAELLDEVSRLETAHRQPGSTEPAPLTLGGGVYWIAASLLPYFHPTEGPERMWLIYDRASGEGVSYIEGPFEPTPALAEAEPDVGVAAVPAYLWDMLRYEVGPTRLRWTGRTVAMNGSANPLPGRSGTPPTAALLPDELRRSLPPLGATAGQDLRALARVKFFMPDGPWTWYATEFDHEDTFYGLVIGAQREVGYFSLEALQAVRGALGLPVERDVDFEPTALAAL
jgi:hypothetical protein